MQHRLPAARPAMLALSFGLFASGVVPQGPRHTAPIAGLWRFNAERSAQGDRKPDEDRPSLGPGEAGREPGGFPGGGGGRGGPRRSRGGPGYGDPAQIMPSLRPILQLLIRQDDSTVAISDAAGQMEVFRTDGRKVMETLLNGDESETVAKWKDGVLSIERKLGKSGMLKESYRIDSLSMMLVVEVKASGSRLPRKIELRRVYDRAIEG
jgi:hypothetical protein